MRDGSDYGAQLASPVEAHLGQRGYEKYPLGPYPMCGRELARARHARYCSPACRRRAVRRRKAARDDA